MEPYPEDPYPEYPENYFGKFPEYPGQGSSEESPDEQMDVLNSTSANAYGGRRRRSRKSCGSCRIRS
jgi:hypothetical protein